MFAQQIMDTRQIYAAVDQWATAVEPFSNWAKEVSMYWDERLNPHIGMLPDAVLENPQFQRFRRIMAISAMIAHRRTRAFEKPDWDIYKTEINNKVYRITEEEVFDKTFCTLINFKKEGAPPQPKMLIVAPMAGHYATLLRGTVEGFLPYFDVYVTDWKNARNIPLSQGSFDFDSFIDYCIEFMRMLGPDLHVVGVCQPGPALVAACSILAAENDPAQPATLSLFGSPVDTSSEPTRVNHFGSNRSEAWFGDNVIAVVPKGHAGAGRIVYPGFIQLSGFMGMNINRHMQSSMDAIKNYVNGDFEEAEKIAKFYDEYNAVIDLTAEFYMQTIRAVFQERLLPRGKLISRGRKVSPSAIKNTALFAVEGEKDDICGLGQTKAMLELTPNVPDDCKEYLLVEGAGHYGIFNGSRFRKLVVPKIVEFAMKHGGTKKQSRPVPTVVSSRKSTS